MLTLTKVPNKPLVILNLSQEQNDEARGAQAVGAIGEFFAAQQTPVFLIMDTRDLTYSLDTLTENMNFVSHQKAIFTHPMLREIMVIVNDPTLALAMKGLSSSAFGNVQLRVFSDMEQATSYVDAQLRAG